MGESLGSVLLELSTRDVDLTKGLNQAERAAQQFDRGMRQSSDRVVRGLRGVESQANQTASVFKNVSQLLAVFGVGFSVAGILSSLQNLIRTSLTVGDELAKMSVRTGETVETLSSLKLAADLSDSSLQDVGNSLRFLNVAIVAAQQGTGEAREAFQALGLSISDLSKISGRPAEAMALVAQRLLEVNNVTNRNVIAQRLFGRSAQDLLPFLKQLATEGLEGLRQEAERLGLVFSTEAAQAAEEFNDNLTRLSAAVVKLAADLAGPLIQALNDLAIGFGLITQSPLGAQISEIDRTIARLRQSQAELQRGLQVREGVGGFLWQQLFGVRDATEAEGRLQGITQALEALQRSRAALVATRDTSQGTGRTGELPDTEGLRRAEAEAKKLAEEIKRVFEETRSPLERFTLGLERLQQLRLPPDVFSRAVGNLSQELTRADPGLQAFLARLSEAETIAASVRTPFEQFVETLRQLEAIRAELGDEFFGRALAKAANDFAATTPEVQAFNAAMQRGLEITQQFLTPLERYNQEFAKLINLVLAGHISFETFRRAIAGLNEDLQNTNTHAVTLTDVAQTLGHNLTSAFEEAIFSGQGLSEVFAGLLEDIARLILRLLVMTAIVQALRGAGVAVTGGLALPGGRHGLDFTVGGAGGPDSQLVAFAASPGERVLAIPPGQSVGSSPVHVQVINYSGASVQTETQPNDQGGQDIRILVGQMVGDALNQPGSPAQAALRGTFGATPALVRR